MKIDFEETPTRNMEEASEQRVVFRKASKKRIRKKKDESTKHTNEGTTDKEARDDEPLSAVLRERRQMQKERERVKGCEASALSSEVLALISTNGGGYSVVIDEDNKEGGLQSTFIVQQDTGQEVNPLLEQYIQQGLKEFREKKAKTVLEKQKSGAIRIEEPPKPGDFDSLKEAEKQLYVIPDHLKAKESSHSDDTVSESWLTGIQEVELPMEYKLKNIEETEDAKKQLLQQHPSSAKDSSMQYNTRFQTPRSDMQSISRASGQKRNKPEEKPNSEKQSQASDDATFDRFKKRFRY